VNYGSLLPPDFNVPKSSFHIRKDLTTSNPFSELFIPRGAIVMDCGGHIGTFAAAALYSGAFIVYSFEPDSRNFKVLSENLKRFGSHAHPVLGALVGSQHHGHSVELKISGFTGAHSIVKAPQGKHRVAIVPAIQFRDALLRLQPAVLKVDVESAEYDLFDSLAPGDLACVTSLFIEFHPIAEREKRFERVRELVRSEGLTEQVTRLRRYTAQRYGETDNNRSKPVSETARYNTEARSEAGQ